MENESKVLRFLLCHDECYAILLLPRLVILFYQKYQICQNKLLLAGLNIYRICLNYLKILEGIYNTCSYN